MLLRFASRGRSWPEVSAEKDILEGENAGQRLLIGSGIVPD